jgi:uncharacterized protein
MENSGSMMQLRIYISSTDKVKDEILYESIVLQAKKWGMAGATVIKGVLGFGASSVIHSYKFWEISEKVPVVVEITDEKDKLTAFYDSIRPILEGMRFGCLVTRSEIEVILYKPGKKNQLL